VTARNRCGELAFAVYAMIQTGISEASDELARVVSVSNIHSLLFDCDGRFAEEK
jgi:hypothetical protein